MFDTTVGSLIVVVNFHTNIYTGIKRLLTMRKGWTDHVAETRRKGNRGKKTMSHKDAMRAASVTWPKAKAKLERKNRKARGSGVKPPLQKKPDKPDENDEQ
jgi:hypothetical protein